MKKLILLLLGIAVGFGLGYFYFNSNSTEEDMANRPKGVITPAEAKVLDTAFNNKHQLDLLLYAFGSHSGLLISKRAAIYIFSGNLF